MNSIIDKMLTLTAEIAEELLAAKDAGMESLQPKAKLLIIELAEQAAKLPDGSAEPQEAVHEAEAETEAETEEITAIETTVAETVGEKEPEEEEKDAVPEIDETETPEIAVTETVTVSEPEPEPVAMTEPAPEPVKDEPEPTPEPAPEPKPEPVKEPEPVPVKEPEPAQAPVDLSLWRQLFSINDLFYFRRELFHGSDTLFNEALGRIGNARSSADVRTILQNNYGIDLRLRPAKEFMNIVSMAFEY